jgi:hypothetical protein
MPQDVKLNDEQKAAVEKGKRIGFLIAALNLPDEEKEQIIRLLPEMSAAQLDVFLAALEKNFLEQSGRQADVHLREGLEKTADEYQSDMLGAQKKANDALSALEKQIAK